MACNRDIFTLLYFYLIRPINLELNTIKLCIQEDEGSDVCQNAACLQLTYSWNSSKSNTGIASSNRPRLIFPYLFQFIIPNHPTIQRYIIRQSIMINTLSINHSWPTYRAGWDSGSVLLSYSGDTRLKFRPGDRIFWVRLFVAFLRLSRQMLR
jgi:hypothetical protein